MKCYAVVGPLFAYRYRYAKKSESPNEPSTHPEASAQQRKQNCWPEIGRVWIIEHCQGSSQAPLHITTRGARGHTAAAAASPLDQHDREDDDNEQRAAAPDGDTDDGTSGEHRGAVRGGSGRDGRAARLYMEEA